MKTRVEKVRTVNAKYYKFVIYCERTFFAQIITNHFQVIVIDRGTMKALDQCEYWTTDYIDAVDYIGEMINV